MINFNFETNFELQHESKLRSWIEASILNENCTLGELNYIFCDDIYLHKLNMEYLNHDTLTDIISFDYCIDKCLIGDIFISVERVVENASMYNVDVLDELRRVMIHGVLHFCGYKDKTDAERGMMRDKENFYLSTYS